MSEKKKLVVRTLTVQGVTLPLQGWLPASVLRFCVLCALLPSGSLNWISAGLPRGKGGGGGWGRLKITEEKVLAQGLHSLEKSLNFRQRGM